MYYVSILIFSVCCSASVSNEEKQPSAERSTEPERLSILLLTSIYPAHFFPLLALGEELIARGHNVTMLGPKLEGYEQLQERAKEKGITVSSSSYEPRSSYDNSRHAGKHEGNSILGVLYNLVTSSTETNLRSGTNYITDLAEKVDGMRDWKYNYTVCDNAVINVCSGIVRKRNTDRVMLNLSPIPLLPFGQTPWSYPSLMSPLIDNMSFKDRLLNTAIYTPMEWFALKMISLFFMDFDSESFTLFLGVKYPIIYNTVMGFDWPRNTLPLQHYVGPMLSSSPPPLDSGIVKWLESKPPKSVVYVSMGTSVDVSPEVASSIIKLAINGYSVVWSLRESSKSSLQHLKIDEQVVYITPWLSQISLLRHPSILYSLMHCGTSSVQESLYHGVPVICIPSAYDQYDVSLRLVSQSLGVRVLPHEVNEDSLKKALKDVSSEVIENNVKKMSIIMRANGGTERVADLIELYADIGHSHGVPSYAKYGWYWYQYYNLDVYIVIVIGGVVLVWLVHKLCCSFCSCCCSSTKKSSKKKKD